jgi:putative transcriptional regulator
MRVRAAGILFLVLLAGGSSPARAASDPASGIFLVASQTLEDPNFRETVVLVTQPRQGGPVGVIINRPFEDRLGEVFPNHSSLKSRQDPVFFGGPVAPQGVLFLVRTEQPPERAAAILRDVYLTGDINWVDGRLKEGQLADGLRAYAGYSGWARGQLQHEIGRGDWHVVPADAETIFSKDPASIWPELLKRAVTRHTRALPEGASFCSL